MSFFIVKEKSMTYTFKNVVFKNFLYGEFDP